MVFWMAAALIAALCAVIVLVFAARVRAPETEAQGVETEVYQRQIRELDGLKDQGLLDDEGYETARTEAARRLLQVAAEDQQTTSAPSGKYRPVVLASVLGVSLATFGLYFVVGSPGMADQPYAARLSSWIATAQTNPASLDPERLSRVMEELGEGRQSDPQYWFYLGKLRQESGNYIGAARAFEQSARLNPAPAEVWTALGEALTLLADGTVSPDARKAFGEALKRDPQAQGARYYLATQAIADGDVAGGKATLAALRDELPPEDPRRAALQAQMTAAETKIVSGAAAAMAGASAEDQQAMIQGMVEGLAARLAENPDDPEGWVRLVRAYGVLGDKARQAEALKAARARYKDKPDILNALDQAAS